MSKPAHRHWSASKIDEESVEEQLSRRLELSAEIDELIEQVQRTRGSLKALVAAVLPFLREHLGAEAIILQTRDESLEERRYVEADSSQKASAQNPLQTAQALHENLSSWPGDAEINVRIDLAGECLGTLSARFASPLNSDERARRAVLLEAAAEQLDNFLKAIHVAREKHLLTRRMHRDLLHPLAEEGIKAAVASLGPAVEYDWLLVVYYQSGLYEQAVRTLVFRNDGSLAFDSQGDDTAALMKLLAQERRAAGVVGVTSQLARLSKLLVDSQDQASSALAGDTPINESQDADSSNPRRPSSRDLRGEKLTAHFLKELGYERPLEFALESGLRESTVLGKVLVCSRNDLTVYERDLVACFADALQKRIIDFDRESRQLSRTFNTSTVSRLLHTEDYSRRYLDPRRADLAILFTDISGFTRISEQVLGDAWKVGAFIQSWGEGVVEILWRYNGACDKFVGDCLIGLFGPPFFDASPAELCESALRCAAEIANYTRNFAKSEEWQRICDVEVELGVATGLNYCNASVGNFGLNCGYTAFAAGVNNTARLQGVAVRDEILVMDEMAQILDGKPGLVFGELREAKVKNVRDPLRFRAASWPIST